MAEETPSLHIDTDWKKQAQEEKRKLAEAAEKAKTAPAATTSAVTPVGAPPARASQSTSSGGATSAAGRRGRAARDLPPPGFGSLVQSIMTQVLYYLGELATGAADRRPGHG